MILHCSFENCICANPERLRNRDQVDCAVRCVINVGKIDASCFFTGGDKVAIQAWFGSYVFIDKSGKTVCGPTLLPSKAVEVAS